MRFRFHLAVAVLLMATQGARAQNAGLTLEQAITDAHNKSPKVQRARAAAHEADWRRVEALSGFLPSVSASASHLMGYRYQLTDISLGGAPMSIPQVIPSSTVTLNASLPLFDGLQNVNRYASARWGARAAELDADWAEFQVRQEVTLKFIQALAAQELAKVNEQNVKTLEDHLTKSEALRRGGAATNYDVLRVEVQLNEARTEALQSNDNVVLTRQALNEILGEEEDMRPLSGELPLPVAGLTANLKKEGIVDRADLQATAQRETAAYKADIAAGRYWVPRFSLNASYIYYNNLNDETFDSSKYRDAYTVGLYLTWNIFDGMTSIARSQQAAYQLEQAQRTTKEKQLRAPYDFEFWKRRYEYSSALFVAKKSAVAKAEESVRLASEGLRAGTRTSSEMLDAELDLFRARAGVVSAESSAAEALINLESAIGRKIENGSK